MTTVSSTTSTTTQTALTSQVEAAPSAAASRPSSPAAGETAPATLTISGRAMMMSRLFPGTPPDSEPNYYTSVNAPRSGSTYASFLAPSDRKVLCELYEWAQTEGVDPRQVDALAYDMSVFRSMSGPAWNYPGSKDSVGDIYDPVTGKAIVPAFTDPADEAIAQRTLTSKAMSDTRIPPDFLRWELDAGFRGGRGAVDFDVLERMVYATSRSGSDGAHDPSAVLPPRPAERLAMMKAAGMIRTPEQQLAFQAKFAPTANEPLDGLAAFDKYSERIKHLTPFLSDDNKSMLGLMYAQAEANGAGPDSREMRKIDRLARDMALMAMTRDMWAQRADEHDQVLSRAERERRSDPDVLRPQLDRAA